MFRKYLLNKDFFIFFWLPRITFSILFFFVYKNIHLNIDDFNSASKQFDYIPDYEKYLYTLKWNPLFSLALQSIHKFFDKTGIVQIVLAQLISGFSCITIFSSSKRLLKISKLALLMMAIHPMLILYGSKFCTENFGLVAIAIYLLSRLEIKEDKFLTRLKLLKIQSKAILYQFICTLFRAQNVILLIYEIYCFLKDSFPNIINQLLDKKKRIAFLILILGGFIFISFILINSFSTYINVMSSYFWDNPFLLDAKKVFNTFFPDTDNASIIQLFFGYVMSYLVYLFLALFLLTGARERLVYEPWAISIGNFNLNYDMGSSLNESSLSTIYNNDFLIDFCLKVLLPLILFSIFHIIGLFLWHKKTKNLGYSISIYPLSIGLLPLLMHPIMRYFIPLIPIACIGFSILLSNTLSKRLNLVKENIL